MRLNRDQLNDARNWLKECYSNEDDQDAIDQACYEDIEKHIELEYNGGIKQFIKDGE